MAVRCIRCGTYVEGLSQVCDSCAAEKKSAETAAREAAVKATTNVCPSCSQEIPRASVACPNCGHSFAKEGFQLTPYVRADFVARLVAYLIDTFGFALGALLVIFATGADVAPAITLASVAYFLTQIVFWMTLGATPGKLLMGIKIVTMEGEPMGIGHCLLRTLAYILINAFGNILYLLILIKADKRGIEDMISGTQVVYRDTIPKREPTASVAPAS